MTEPFLTLASRPALTCSGVIRYSGALTAEVTFAEPVELTGLVDLKIGPTVMRCAVDPRRSAKFVRATQVAVVGGAGGWGKAAKELTAHNDSGVRRSTIAGDLAREVGETLVVDAGVDDTPGRPAGGVLEVDWLRVASRAAAALELLYPDVPWWVALDGTTHVGPRTEFLASGVELLNFDKETQVATLALSGTAGLEGVLPGARLVDAERAVDAVVQDLAFDAKGGLTLSARCVPAGDIPLRSQFADEMRAFVLSLFPEMLLRGGLFRYRVARQLDERVELQAVRVAAGVPDTLAIPIHPGVPGVKAKLDPGTIVLVQFVEGSPAFPIVTHAQRADGDRFVPLELELAAQDELRFVVGRDVAANPVGRPVLYGDPVTVGFISGPIAPTGTPPTSKAVFS